MKKVYFISDVHIGSHDQENEILKEKYLRSFFSFLNTQEDFALYILGDLFDFWFEYKHAIPTYYQHILSKLMLLRERDIPITFISGNHDFWMRRFFEKQMGIRTYHGVHTETILGKSFYFFHGDGLVEKDVGYRILKKILQNPFVIWLYRWIHPDIGIPIARYASHLSRNHYMLAPEQAAAEDAEYLTYAREQFRKGYEIVVMGHTHRSVFHKEGEKVYINLGDWMVHFTYAVFDGTTLEPRIWHPAEDDSFRGIHD
ncbi:UDP-2,3-diacylglucosamine hydrolase [bacterium BMS3Abin05]|nr:UDP-2,3-diacylglucosamine hydrolase [bacterium BMS3Abin05]GBE26861.1 UDP-2,3-diacylglucosamine hydrolase [bacterium BMS3Bbin03]HDL78753.1 UDP-2,3-diacylglucosamine diphosphatase [Bacteroidota bacterium]HDZ10591.1 UDP-2,3-diacylglucosamine diphosphatase [Bacteroidota bacterium]